MKAKPEALLSSEKHPDGALKSPMCLIIVATLTVIHKITGVDIRPVEVSFVHNAPEKVAPYEDYFSCEVQFGEKYNRLEFRKALSNKNNHLTLF